ncbi:hypothetical protein AMS68_000086 [Peltaster fructicola]|uniref:Glycosyltransferase 2-like domain-containing protein n=1 Tax=Peltaster fructicola TaxID=286661 RepID=A0A6H0XIV7_9PEZI|nr:hypothetical protein AMS68_000086 [Peltaster fructicola]
MTIGFGLFVAAFAFRYLRLIVGIIANLTYKAYPIADRPCHAVSDVSVIIPTTFKHSTELACCLKSISICRPAQIFVVTADSSIKDVESLCIALSLTTVRILGVEHLNKRRQLLRALELVDTKITVFADDNVIWPDGYLDHLLAIFEDPRIGAGGSRQRVRRMHKPDVWNFLAISYLERRVFNNISTQAIDGSISTLSGRTAAYRTEILRNDRFYHYFLNDSWRGRKLNTDDDKCLTRFVYSRGWKIALQTSVVIETTMESGWNYIEQCKRWARAHWRGNLVVMAKEQYWYSPRYLWGFYAIYLAQFQTPALLVDGALYFLLRSCVANREDSKTILSAFVFWIISTKLTKLTGHFIAHPQDTAFIPVSILFSYLHGIINIHALLTLHITAWGSQQLDILERPKEERRQAVPSFTDTLDTARDSVTDGEEARVHLE